MFFHIDESGNSGNNLFDPQQPVLSYGVLSSNTNVDVLAGGEHAAILRKIGADAIHANRLGVGGLMPILPDLVRLHRKFNFRFDYYFVHKESYAIAMLFDAIFDAGLNEAVKWDWYWTPLRFPLVAAIGSLADEPILKEGWDLRLLPRKKLEGAQGRIVKLLSTLLERLDAQKQGDARMREILGDGLRFGIKHPLELDFGTDIPNFMSPNAIGFQFVLTSVASRLKAAKRKALRITVDRQSQFNPAQRETHTRYAQIAATLRKSPTDRDWYVGHPVHEGARQDIQNLISHFPEEKITISTSADSFGLQIADTYLWIVNRGMTGDLPAELQHFGGMLVRPEAVDGISIAAMVARFNAFERRLPQAGDIAPEVKARHEAAVEAHRQKVKGMNL